MNKTKILVNSIPKSGTNLVQKCLELAGVPYSGRSLAASSNLGRHVAIKSILRCASNKETPIFIGLETPVSVSPKWLKKYLRGASGYVSGHSAFSQYYHSILLAEGYKTIQVLRHPCAILASWANYIVEPNYYWAEAQHVFSRLSLQDRMHLMLYGDFVANANGQINYLSYKELWEKIQGWVDSKDVLTIKYEDLVGAKGGGNDELQRETISKILVHIGMEDRLKEVNRIATNLYGGTHTFRQGNIEGWRKLMNAELQLQVYEQLHDLPLIKSLGYLDDIYANSYVRSVVNTTFDMSPIKQSIDNKLKILLVTEGYGKSLFGVAKVVEDLHQLIAQYGALIKVATIVTDNNETFVTDDSIVELPYWHWTKTMRFHLQQPKALRDVIDSFQPDVIHVHGIMVPLQLTTVLFALKRKIPIIISVHGMLQPWLWLQNGFLCYWFKRIYWSLLIRPVLRQATIIHAITLSESKILEGIFTGMPQLLIPNSINFDEFSTNQIEPDGEKYILFLGRLHPVKGIHMLIEAFSELKKNSCKLVICGPTDSVQYTNQLNKLVNQTGIEKNVTFVGKVEGQQKKDLLSKAWVVVVPSYSEVIAIVNLEAAASFTPTITTNMTGLNDWGYSGGLLIDPDVKQLTQAIEVSLSWSLEDRLARGRQSRQFVADHYSWDVMSKRWMETYQKIASNVQK